LLLLLLLFLLLLLLLSSSDLLHRLKFWDIASFIIAKSNDENIRRLNQVGVMSRWSTLAFPAAAGGGAGGGGAAGAGAVPVDSVLATGELLLVRCARWHC
jgi:hypothetical protein